MGISKKTKQHQNVHFNKLNYTFIITHSITIAYIYKKF